MAQVTWEVRRLMDGHDIGHVVWTYVRLWRFGLDRSYPHILITVSSRQLEYPWRN